MAYSDFTSRLTGQQWTRMNLNTFARQGVFDGELDGIIAKRLRDPEAIRRARAYPYQLLIAYANAAQAVPAIGKDACEVTRVPAGDIDAKVVDQVRKVLQAPEVVAQAMHEVHELSPGTDKNQTIQTLRSIESVWEELFPAEQSRITHLLVDRVTVSPTGIKIDMKTEGMKDLVKSVLADPNIRKAA